METKTVPFDGYLDTPFIPGSKWRVHDKARPQPPIVQPGAAAGAPPSDAVILFNGQDMAGWVSVKTGDPAAWKVSVRGADKLAATLREHRAEATLYTTLATLRLDCPIACSLDELRWTGPDRPALAAICDELGIEVGSIRL